MKIINNPTLSFISIFALSVLLANTSHASTPSPCNRSCPGVGTDPIQYPFGFSPGCEIHLKCTPHSGIFIGEFPIQTITPDSIRVTLQSRCNRPLHTLRQLYGPRYAPTSRSSILLQNCTDGQPSSSCNLPNILVQARFDAPPNCSSNSSLSCYAETGKDVRFLDFESIKRRDCKFLLSSISASLPQVLEVEVVELGWWLEGTCGCHKNANCTTVESPNGTQGFTCKCNNGLLGDGYVAGSGCWKAFADNSGNWKRKVIVGAAAAAAAGSGILLCVIVCCIKNRKQTFMRTKSHQDLEVFIQNNGPLAVKRYKFSDIRKMTNSFKDKLGQGGYGDVYKGKLRDGCLVAVKVLNASKGNGEDFINEVASISRTSHVNVVTLLGYCFEGQKKALIYEFMPNGSLEKFIYKENSLKTTPHLELEKLFEIAIGIARGLEYLHRGCNTRILHFDIKPHNILLDDNFCPKISDFGLSKLCLKKESIMSMLDARGTIGYIAPEVFCRNFGGVSVKSDVYSYGMMILEVVGGRKNNDVQVSHTTDTYFPDWIYKHLEQGSSNLGLPNPMTQEENELARKMILVGLWCIQTKPSDRPSMSKVIEMLEGSIEALQIPPKPYLTSPIRTPAESESSTFSLIC